MDPRRIRGQAAAMLLALVPGALALSLHPWAPLPHRSAAPRMTFLSPREDVDNTLSELRRATGAMREAVAGAPAGGSVTEQRPATWADAAERLAEMRAMQELDQDECVLDEPCLPGGGIVLLRHGESEWNAANRYRATPLPHIRAAPSPSAATAVSPGHEDSIAAALLAHSACRGIRPVAPAPPFGLAHSSQPALLLPKRTDALDPHASDTSVVLRLHSCCP